ncbi:unnamed protein product [Phyllotreta striolata]|uniref:ShKT domain-containing protein n=1 Tax=Phyllotreta striolata TaxID=444603 RepID=A0A9N9XM53_PHYSR|nr:unnamed protein product [Phyllotreta striolata]
MLLKSCIFSTIFLWMIHANTSEFYSNKEKYVNEYNTSIDPLNIAFVDPRITKSKKKIVSYHNHLRSIVQPTASNMLRMRWHKKAASAAQRWASKCIFLTHDDDAGRYIDNYGACGQNIFVSTYKVNWFEAIKTWWMEKNLFIYGKPNQDYRTIGHYTQVVWATTHRVGCGFAECFSDTEFGTKVFYNYVCNYCPAGNRRGKVHRPYKRGEPCNSCKRHCGKNKLCQNGCNAADHYSNCRDLFKRFPTWLCSTDTREGMERKNNCLATCTCRHKIYD